MIRRDSAFFVALLLFTLGMPLASYYSMKSIPTATFAVTGTSILNAAPVAMSSEALSFWQSKSCDYITFQSGIRTLSFNTHTRVGVYQGANATNVIQKTLNELSVGGGTDCLGRGVYYLDHGLIISGSHVNLVGEGNDTTLTFTDASTKDNLLTIGLGAKQTINTPEVTGVIQNVTVSSIAFDGEKKIADPAIAGGEGFEVQNMGIWVLGSRYVTIQSVWVKNVGQYCIYFRSTRPTFTPYSPSPQPVLYNTVIDSHLSDCRTGIYIDGIAPSDTMGWGNRVIGNTIIQDWNSMNIDVPGNSQGFGIADSGVYGTLIMNNHVAGYTPNPLVPSHTAYSAYLVDGNSTSALFANNTASNSYFGINFGLAGAAQSAASKTIIDNFATYNVRYSIAICGFTANAWVNGLNFTNPRDSVSGLGGIGVWIDAQIPQLFIRNIDGRTDSNYTAIGNDGILQIVSGVPAPDTIAITEGAKNNLNLDFVLGTFPNNLTIRQVSGYNPVGEITDPFGTTPDRISPFGSNSTPFPSTGYIINGCDVDLTSTGGAGVSITIKDEAANVVLTSATTLTNYLLPQGYSINFGSFSEAPKVTVLGE